ncbi:hypothetical protein EON83_20380 [bacterium]|nr:MAG: hypothetical protein EON83_20380 [bacterium]
MSTEILHETKKSELLKVSSKRTSKAILIVLSAVPSRKVKGIQASLRKQGISLSLLELKRHCAHLQDSGYIKYLPKNVFAPTQERPADFRFSLTEAGKQFLQNKGAPPTYSALNLTWHCKADDFGSFATDEMRSIFLTSYSTRKFQWNLEVLWDAEKATWISSVTRYPKNRVGLLCTESGKWSLGPFENMHQAQLFAETFFFLRIDPATWNSDRAVMPSESYGHYTLDQISKMVLASRAARKEAA